MKYNYKITEKFLKHKWFINTKTGMKVYFCRCKTAEEKYGKPSRCDMCKNAAYFNKGLEAKKKVDNKSLCLLCTLKYKKELHRSGKFKRSSAEIITNKSSSKSRKLKAASDATTAETQYVGIVICNKNYFTTNEILDYYLNCWHFSCTLSHSLSLS